ncbi:hypothetical protein N9051_01235 [Akkermansiaceae bacterium]|nr:hypothetical protein [Akkermansiaceae bacterium]
MQWILNNPNESGGWNYQYEEKPRWDTSINVWHLQALKAAQTSGLEFKNMRRIVKSALNTITETQQDQGGFGYNRSGPNGNSDGHFTLTGAGTLCVQQHNGSSSKQL